MTRGESGLTRAVLAALFEDAVLLREDVLAVDAVDPYDTLRDKAGWDVGVLMASFSPDICEDLSKLLSKLLSLKLNRALVLVGAGLIMAGVMFFRKSRYADGGVMGVLRSFSRCFMKPGEPASGLRSSEGKVPEPGV